MTYNQILYYTNTILRKLKSTSFFSVVKLNMHIQGVPQIQSHGAEANCYAARDVDLGCMTQVLCYLRSLFHNLKHLVLY